MTRKRHAPSGQPAAPSASANCSRIIETRSAAITSSLKAARYHKQEVIRHHGRTIALTVDRPSSQLSVLSRAGKEAVVAMLGPGDFFGEGALTGQSIRIGTAAATTLTTVLAIEKEYNGGLTINLSLLAVVLRD